MKILVACEESQRVTNELRKLGHQAYSCDILQTSGNNPKWHIQDDVLKHINLGWDMIIAFPPCTDLCCSGARHFEKKIKDGRQQKAIDFFMKIVNANCEKIIIENPIGIMSTKWRKPDQIIQPWQFGDKATKSTCLWLKGVKPLTPTNIVDKGEFYYFKDKNGKEKRQPLWYYKALTESKSPTERAMIRSKTFPGIAKAMAEQFTVSYK